MNEAGEGRTATAGALLGRMYLGWKWNRPAFARGVEFLEAKGPLRGNLEYDYFTSLILVELPGDHWKAWKCSLHDWLHTEQATEGHAKGSWKVAVDHRHSPGGRLYSTALAVMMLELRARMGIYGKAAAEEDFPL